MIIAGTIVKGGHLLKVLCSYCGHTHFHPLRGESESVVVYRTADCDPRRGYPISISIEKENNRDHRSAN